MASVVTLTTSAVKTCSDIAAAFFASAMGL